MTRIATPSRIKKVYQRVDEYSCRVNVYLEQEGRLGSIAMYTINADDTRQVGVTDMSRMTCSNQLNQWPCVYGQGESKSVDISCGFI